MFVAYVDTITLIYAHLSEAIYLTEHINPSSRGSRILASCFSQTSARSFEPYPLSYKVVRITPESLFHCATDGVLA